MEIRDFTELVIFCVVAWIVWSIVSTMAKKKRVPKKKDDPKKLEQLVEADLKADQKQTEILKDLQREVKKIEHKLEKKHHPKKKLKSIQLALGDPPMQGPLNITVGQSSVASVLGFDQNGQPFTGTMPAASFSVDNPAFDSVDPSTGAIVSLAEGTATISVSMTSAEGLALSDSSQIINAPSAPPAQVLTSIKLDFTQPA